MITPLCLCRTPAHRFAPYSVQPYNAFLLPRSPSRPEQTATLQFSRSIGGTIGVSVMGAVLSWRLARARATAGIDPATAPLGQLVDPLTGPTDGVAVNGALKIALAGGIRAIFVVALLAAAAGLVATAFAPHERIISRKEGVPS